jgi:hypothetical protein
VNNLEPVILIHRSLWSITRIRRAYCQVDVYNGPQGIPVSTVIETAYRRSLFTMTSNLIESSGLSPNEVSLGLSLALTRRR